MERFDHAVLLVRSSVCDEARRRVFLLLHDLLPHKQAHVASAIVRELRAAGLLASALEEHFSAADVARLLGRSPEWVVLQARAGRFGVVSIDGGGWLIPGSGVRDYLTAHTVAGPRKKRAPQTGEVEEEKFAKGELPGSGLVNGDDRCRPGGRKRLVDVMQCQENPDT